jgi:putative ABC transport system permease protein
MLADLRFVIRMALQRPGFVVAVCGTLALGVATVTSMFAFVNSILLAPLPYPKPNELVQICQYDRRASAVLPLVGMPDVVDWKAQAKSFADMAFFRTGIVVLTGVGTPEPIMSIRISDGYLPALQIQPYAGRWFVEDEQKFGPDKVCIISYRLWKRCFNSDPQIIGKTLSLNGTAITIVGLMPSTFRFPEDAQIALTTGFINWERTHRDSRFFGAVGRLKPGVSMLDAESELNGIARQLEDQFPKTNVNLGVRVFRLKDEIVGDTRRALEVLFSAVCCVLVIACANIASLLMVRAVDRKKEFAIRIALGANRLQIANQQLTESLGLAILGGVFSLIASIGCVKVLVALSPARLARLDEVHVSAAVILFCMGISVICGVIFGLVPILQTFRSEVVQNLNEEGKAGSASHGTSWARGAILLFEVALTIFLMIGAGLFIRSYLRAQRVDLGFNPDHIVISRIALRTWQYPSEVERNRLFKPLLKSLEQRPEKKIVALAMWPPFNGGVTVTMGVDGVPKLPGEQFGARMNSVSQRYFETMGMRIIAGRNFEDTENERTPRIVIVNHALATKFFGGRDPVGQRITVQGNGTNLFSVVGVVNDVHQTSFTLEPEPELYFNLLQLNDTTVHVVAKVEHGQDFNSFANGMRKELQLLDGRQAASNPEWFVSMLGRSLQVQKFRTYLLTFFAAIALVLSAVGIFGFLSYTVGQRTREIGILSALGAPRSYIIRTIMKETGLIIGVGVLIGLSGAFAGSKLIETFLFDVKSTDYLTFGVVTLFVVIIGGIAAYLPTRNASRLEVMTALRA